MKLKRGLSKLMVATVLATGGGLAVASQTASANELPELPFGCFWFDQLTWDATGLAGVCHVGGGHWMWFGWNGQYGTFIWE